MHRTWYRTSISIFCRTSSTTGNKLAFLNNIVGIFEYYADKMGNSEKYESGNRTLTSYNSILYHSLFFIICLSVFHTNYYLHVVNYTKIVIICLSMECGVTGL
jgi:hypothetical protein